MESIQKRIGELRIIPGGNSPTQIEMALKRNLSVLKFFPAEAFRGLVMLNSMGGLWKFKIYLYWRS